MSAPIRTGNAGSSLTQGGTWRRVDQRTAQRAAGAERRTAAVLDRACKATGAVALHDLVIPVALPDGGQPNIDHLIVSGTHVHVIDTKMWKPGFCWTLPGLGSFRGFSRFSAADKKTLLMARSALTAFLTHQGIQTPITCTVVAWPSNPNGTLSTWALHVPGASTIPASSLAPWCSLHATDPADARTVTALSYLVRR